MELKHGNRSIKHIVMPYKLFDLSDFMSFNLSIMRWKQHYSEKTNFYIICDNYTKKLLEERYFVYKNDKDNPIKIIEYNKNILDIQNEGHTKNIKTILLNEEIMFIYDLLKEPFLFISDDRFPVAPIDDSFLNRQHHILGKYPKWNVRGSNWRIMMTDGAELMKNEYKAKNILFFKNHYFTVYDEEFINWFKPYMYHYDLSQMRTYYNLYVKKDKKLKDIFKKDMILTTREFGKKTFINTNRFGKDVFGINFSRPDLDGDLLKELLLSTKVKNNEDAKFIRTMVDKFLINDNWFEELKRNKK